ncbi:MAG: hypothetical protein CSA07_02845 [Bacteroidia bacterium]|nr:MAG: hypothetical protein CSA07_02845 [Bacteroidia bacterium]
MAARKPDVRIEDYFPEPRREEVLRPSRAELAVWLVLAVAAVAVGWLLALTRGEQPAELLVPPEEIAFYSSDYKVDTSNSFYPKRRVRTAGPSSSSGASSRRKSGQSKAYGGEASRRPGKGSSSQRKKQALRPRPFNPNTVTAEELEAMGLRRWQAEGLVRHRESRLEKGYIFATAEDFRANREIPDELDEQLVPFLRLESPLREFDPNTVTPEELMAFGLGVSRRRAEGFVKYRDLLFAKGQRFRNVEDFARVRSLSEEAHRVLDGYVRIGAAD